MSEPTKQDADKAWRWLCRWEGPANAEVRLDSLAAEFAAVREQGRAEGYEEAREKRPRD